MTTTRRPAGPTAGAEPRISVRQVVRRLWQVLADYRSPFVQTIAAGLVAQLAIAGAAVLSAVLAGRAVAHPEQPVLAGTGTTAAWLLAGCVLVAGVAGWWEMYVAHDLAYLVIAGLRVRLFCRLLRVLPSRRKARRTGDLVTAAVSDIEGLEWIYAHLFGQVVVAGVVLSGGSLALALVDPLLLAVVLPVAALVLSVPWWWFRRADRQGQATRAAIATLNADLVETVDGIAELTAAGAIGRRVELLRTETQALNRLSVRTSAREAAEAAATEFWVAGAAVAGLLITMIGVRDGRVDAAAAPVVLALMGVVLAPAAAIAGVLRNVGNQRAAAARIFAVMDEPDTVDDPVDPVPPGEPGSAPVLQVRGVRFSYDGLTPVLADISLDIHDGETVALAGVSGAGKSTMIHLLQRFFDPDAGRILLDGVELNRLADGDLRAAVGVVSQDVQLFAGTLRDNLTLGRPQATDAEVAAVATAAGLDEVVAGIRGGLDGAVGARGATLSGGQRARVAIARALLVRPRLLVLDEAVANLDTESELDLHRALASAPDRPATLVVGHRESTMARCDRVVMLDRGRIVDAAEPEGAADVSAGA